MVVQHNISAINSHRNLLVNNSATGKNLEKLSSGYRINRAGDDAAGLAISEKMRGQIRGLAMAEQNANNGISLIQTAEGGLNETHAILQRMRELAVQASNGTYTEEDREQIELEVQALKGEINRISASTNYNGIYLLDGSLGGKEFNNVSASNLALLAAAGLGAFGAGAQLHDYANDYFTSGAVAKLIFLSGASLAGTGAGVYLQVGDKIFAQKAGSGTKFVDEFGNTVASIAAAFLAGATDSAGVITNITIGTTAIDVQQGVIGAGSKTKLIFQIGANGTLDQRVGLHTENMTTASLGLAGLNEDKLHDITIKDRDDANDAIKVIDAATKQVSAQRAELGALQNRLEHTVANLGVTRENLTAAESTIRDVDMAKEMMEFTKNNILVQASQAMLAQANALPQGILSLLR